MVGLPNYQTLEKRKGGPLPKIKKKSFYINRFVTMRGIEWYSFY